MHTVQVVSSRSVGIEEVLAVPGRRCSPRIVALGGGTGLPAVLEGLALDSRTRDEITGIVTVTDDGGSSGTLRGRFGVLPPGDVRNCLVALARKDSPFRDLLQHRLGDGPEPGHPVGNLLLSALTQLTGDFSEAISQIGTLVESRGHVMPSTMEDVRLRAEMMSGEEIAGETAIVHWPSAIRRLFLDPSPKPTPDTLRALVNADAIVIGPGSLYTSVLPTLLVEGVAATIYGMDAVRIYVANLMTQPGETDHYTLADHLRAIREHTGYFLFDYILVNRSPIDPQIAADYARKGSHPVNYDLPSTWEGAAQVVACDLAPRFDRGKVRHDAAALGRAIRRLVAAGRPNA